MEDSIPNLIQHVTAVLSAGKSDFGSLHPLIVHFPIALFCVIPLLIFLGMIFPRFSKPLYACAVIFLWLGTLSAFMAVKSGELASETLSANPGILETFESHEHLAEKSRTIFLILSVLFSLYFLTFDTFLKKLPGPVKLTILTAFLCFYFYGLLILFNAAHYGGKLVHFHGVHTKLYTEP